jgi:hypothetical protein
MYIFAQDKDSFEDQLKVSEQFLKIPSITVKAVGLNNEFYGAVPYIDGMKVIQILGKIVEKIDTRPDQYQVSIQFEDLVVECEISPEQIQYGKESNINVGLVTCNAVFSEFFIKLCEHCHSRNSQGEAKEATV